MLGTWWIRVGMRLSVSVVSFEVVYLGDDGHVSTLLVISGVPRETSASIEVMRTLSLPEVATT
jgi:hypothetical protein